MVGKIFKTGNDPVATLLRVTLGLVMFPHGAQKVLGWFGGYGFPGTMQYFTQQAHIPALFAVLAIMAEFVGSILLITGLATRLAAFGVLVNMVVAVLLVHDHVGFFMNWYGQYAAGQEGFEYHLLASALAIAIIVRGGGTASVDRKLSARPA